MTLPEAFVANMSSLLSKAGGEEEAASFFDALQTAPKVSGLRCNTLKVGSEELRELFDKDGRCCEISFVGDAALGVPRHTTKPRDAEGGVPYEGVSQPTQIFSPIPWCPEGFYYEEGTFRPSKHPLYQAGLYYLQEPSAMAPAVLLNPRPGEKVLDLCAAPGGKAAQLAVALKGEGLLVANEPSASRGRALVKNLTLAGVRNAVILNEQPRRLAERFPEYFDKILIDAPCSGEGMFRKDKEAAKAWTGNKPAALVPVQREILQAGAKMLKPGGIIAYSTCTFNTRENEELILGFLQKSGDFEPVCIHDGSRSFSQGLLGLTAAARLWPHKIQGEGHFVCLLRKKGDAKFQPVTGIRTKTQRMFSSVKCNRLKSMPQIFKDFCDDFLTNTDIFAQASEFKVINVSAHRHLYMLPKNLPDLKGLRVARSGWYLGDIKPGKSTGKPGCTGHTGRFEPSHAFALGLESHDARYVNEMREAEAAKYLRGESLDAPQAGALLPKEAHTQKPWVLMCLHGFALGWARLVNGRLKNKYPAGWVSP